MRTTQSWGGVPDMCGLAVRWWPHRASSSPQLAPPRPSAHWLAHCLACCPRLSVHLLPQQLCVEEGGFTQVLGWKMGAQELWDMSPGPVAPLDPDLLSGVPTWLSWVPSPWAWAGSGHARRAHSSWMWLKQRLAVAAELLCLEEESMGSS